MAKGSGGTRGSSYRDKQNKSKEPSYSRGLEMYQVLLNHGEVVIKEGIQSWDIQKSIDSSFAYPFDTKKVSESDIKSLDKVFTPIGKDTTLYKGSSEDTIDYYLNKAGVKNIESLAGKSFVDKFYSSLTTKKEVANDYAYKNDFGTPVITTFKLSKTAKVAVPDKLGIATTDNEITLGRNQKYTFESAKLSTDDYGDECYKVVIRVG